MVSTKYPLYWLLGMVLFTLPASASEGFPLRERFSGVPVISLEALKQGYDEIVIVDSRTRFEYDTIHINKAIRIPISSKSFMKLLDRQVPDRTTKVAFYCNGVTCSKSYRAAALAARSGYTNAYSFDAGVFAWAKAHPELTTLLGTTPMSADQLISEEKFYQHLIGYQTFRSKATEPDSLVIDVRDAAQRRNSDGTRNDLPDEIKLNRERHLKFNLDLLKRKLDQKKYLDKQLLIFDAAGKQVKWLQYSLEKNGYTNYHFLKGGIYSITQVEHH